MSAVRRVAPFLPLLTAACFASRNDVRLLQQDLADTREQVARTDSLRAQQLSAVSGALRTIDQMLRSMNNDLARRDADTRGELRALASQILQVQELTGQSQKRIQEIRAEIEAASRAAAERAAPPSDTTMTAAAPGPYESFRLAREQLQRGSTGTARAAFEDFLQRYPDSELASEAQYFVAESYAAEQNSGLADSVYALVVSRYPQSAKAPTALYKRAEAMRRAGRTREARTLYNTVISKYGSSDEARLSRDALRTLR